ncbi:hypothetical protein F5Y01DRAFT_314566 [Xylaria sp. FL0043]|nr:hypothetical protein F5Y01DRAFT_314566 [Xylaria sp. FL0043]
MDKFLGGGTNGVPLKLAKQACEECRRRKKRCLHVNAVTNSDSSSLGMVVYSILETRNGWFHSKVDHEEPTEPIPQQRSSPLATTASPASSSQFSALFEPREYIEGISQETAITPISSNDDDDDLITLLRKNQKRAEERTCSVIRTDNWPSMDLDFGKKSKKLLKFRKRPHKGDDEHQSHSKKRKRKIGRDHTSKKKKKRKRTHAVSTHDISATLSSDGKHSHKESQSSRLSVCQTDSQAKISHSVKERKTLPPYDTSQTRHPKAANREEKDGVRKTKRPTADPGTVKENGSTYFQAAHKPAAYFNNKIADSRMRQYDSPITRIENYKLHGIEARKQDKRSHTAKSRLAPFRRKIPNISVHPSRTPELDIAEEPNLDKFVVSQVDSGAITRGTRPSTISKPRVPICRNETQLARRIPVSNILQLDDILRKPLTLSEKCEAELIQQLQNRQPPRGVVIPQFKWMYTIKDIDNADIILDEDDKEHRAMTVKSFADREKANKWLDKSTSPEAVGGLEAIVSRTLTVEGPERLLKVDINMANGEHHVLWVERSMVELKKLDNKRREQEQWKPTPRQKLPHYVVTCDLFKYDTSLVRRSNDAGGDDDMMGFSGQDVGLGSYGVDVELQIEKLPPATFTVRELANEYAGKLFLEKSKVDRRFAEPSDVYWWQHNAVPEHKTAVAAACKPDGLYEAKLEAYDMSSRLGWNQIVVLVTEVDDVAGPVNF